ncbi:hypothetical protein [Pontibacillus sp. HMF3514]|uniref:hypothetical protein n=1 Tax=Pontibacillus sp. HMF3514 TaxID=2692425 RepID=UPI00131FF398|nr:hypothetical protein [Pontibacillus sp. HMF3514]QHE51728.1 hypothetical protein GS400_06600 [Pontibacillus sp. HMF3514]
MNIETFVGKDDLFIIRTAFSILKQLEEDIQQKNLRNYEQTKKKAKKLIKATIRAYKDTKVYKLYKSAIWNIIKPKILEMQRTYRLLSLS